MCRAFPPGTPWCGVGGEGRAHPYGMCAVRIRISQLLLPVPAPKTCFMYVVPCISFGGKSFHLTFLRNKHDSLASSRHCSLDRWSTRTLSWAVPLGIPPDNPQKQPGFRLRIVIVGILIASFWFESRDCVHGENVLFVEFSSYGEK